MSKLSDAIAELREDGMIVTAPSPSVAKLTEQRTEILAAALSRCFERGQRRLRDGIVTLPCRRSTATERTLPEQRKAPGISLPNVPPPANPAYRAPTARPTPKKCAGCGSARMLRAAPQTWSCMDCGTRIRIASWLKPDPKFAKTLVRRKKVA